MSDVDAGPGHVLVHQILDGPQQPMPRHDDTVVRRDEILLGAIDNRTHAFLHRRVLHADACDAAERLAGFLRRAVDQIIVVLVGYRPEGAGHVFDVNTLTVSHRLDLIGCQRARGEVVEAPGPAILVIDRNPKVAAHGMTTARRDHREGWHDPLRDPPVIIAVLGVAARPHEQTAGALYHLEHGLGVP